MMMMMIIIIIRRRRIRIGIQKNWLYISLVIVLVILLKIIRYDLWKKRKNCDVLKIKKKKKPKFGKM